MCHNRPHTGPILVHYGMLLRYQICSELRPLWFKDNNRNHMWLLMSACQAGARLSATNLAVIRLANIMMTSSNGNIFRIIDLLCWEFTGHWWIPRTKASALSFDVFFDLRLKKRLSKQSWRRWFETQSCSLWRHCNVLGCDHPDQCWIWSIYSIN